MEASVILMRVLIFGDISRFRLRRVFTVSYTAG